MHQLTRLVPFFGGNTYGNDQNIARLGGILMDGAATIGATDFDVVEYCGRLSCRKPIVQPAGRGRRREFCSETCRRGADREYKRAKALVESSERNLREFQHEVAAYGRRSEDGLATPEARERTFTEAIAALGRAQGVIEFSQDVDDRYLSELRRLVVAVRPLIETPGSRMTA